MISKKQHKVYICMNKNKTDRKNRKQQMLTQHSHYYPPACSDLDLLVFPISSQRTQEKPTQAQNEHANSTQNDSQRVRGGRAPQLCMRFKTTCQVQLFCPPPSHFGPTFSGQLHSSSIMSIQRCRVSGFSLQLPSTLTSQALQRC